MKKDKLKDSSSLTKKKKQEFRDILGRGKYDQQKRPYIDKYIEIFITELDSYLPYAKEFLITEPTNITPARKHLQATRKALEKIIYYFEQQYRQLYPTAAYEDATFYLSHWEPTAGLYKLQKMVANDLDSIRPGRRSAIKTHIPESPGDFNQRILPDRLQIVIQHIVYLYWTHLGKPSRYRNSPLFQVVGKTLDLLGRPLADPYYRIKTAINYSTSSHPHLL